MENIINKKLHFYSKSNSNYNMIRDLTDRYTFKNTDINKTCIEAIKLTQGRCAYTGKQLVIIHEEYPDTEPFLKFEVIGDLSYDHIWSASRGNPLVKGNIVICCKNINCSKGNRDVFEFYEEELSEIDNPLFETKQDFYDFINKNLDIYKNGPHGQFYNCYTEDMTHEEICYLLNSKFLANIDLTLDSRSSTSVAECEIVTNGQFWIDFREFLDKKRIQEDGFDIKKDSNYTIKTYYKYKDQIDRRSRCDKYIIEEFGDISIYDINKNELKEFFDNKIIEIKITKGKNEYDKFKTLFSLIFEFLEYHDNTVLENNELEIEDDYIELRQFFKNGKDGSNGDFRANLRHLINSLKDKNIQLDELTQEEFEKNYIDRIKSSDSESYQDSIKTSFKKISEFFNFDTITTNTSYYYEIENAINLNEDFDLIETWNNVKEFLNKDDFNLKAKKLFSILLKKKEYIDTYSTKDNLENINKVFDYIIDITDKKEEDFEIKILLYNDIINETSEMTAKSYKNEIDKIYNYVTEKLDSNETIAYQNIYEVIDIFDDLIENFKNYDGFRYVSRLNIIRVKKRVIQYIKEAI